MPTVVSPERLRGDLVRLVHRGGGVQDFALGAARILARAVPFDGVCVLTLDPATRLPTSEVVENGLPAATARRMAEIEFGSNDINRFEALARTEPRAATLSQATGGKLDRSLRHRELRQPNGFGDELRAALVDDAAAWGAITLLRASHREHFDPGDATLVASISPYLAEGLRRALLLCAVSGAEHEDDAESAGLLLIEPDGSIALADPIAERWLGELRKSTRGHPLPPAVAAVASQARNIVAAGAATSAVARARVRTASGRWLVVRGSTLGAGADAPTAVIIEAARPHELAPLIADAYRLTERERAITQLVAHGLPTQAIARRLHISPWTVQDHLKSIFEKVDVRTRGELVARIFFDHYAPRLTDGAAVTANGWFAPASRTSPARGHDSSG